MRQFRVILSLVFLFVGGFTLSTIVMSTSGGYNYIGELLINKFSYMAIGIPIFYFWYFVILFTKKHTLELVLWPTISIIPFIIFTLGLKLQFWNGDTLTTPPLAELYYLFGQKGTIIFLYLVGIFVVFGEVLLKIILNQNSHNKNTPTHAYAHVHNYTPHAKPYAAYSPPSRAPQPHAPPTNIAPQCNTSTQSQSSQHTQHTSPQQKTNNSKEEENYFLVFNKKKKIDRIITKHTDEKFIYDEDMDDEHAIAYYRMSDEDIEEESLTPTTHISNITPSPSSEYDDMESFSPLDDDSVVAPQIHDFSDTPHNIENDEQEITHTKKKKSKVYKIPIIGLLDPHEPTSNTNTYYNKEVANILENTLKEFNIDAQVMSILPGPVVTLYEILPAPGVRLKRIVELGDNIALRLAAPSIRIVAPIPGKEAVGIEVPNDKRNMVSFAELISEKQFHKKEYALPIALGKNIANKNVIIDLTRSPHLLIAGATGSGKSVCVNSIISSILYRCTPEDVRLILIDPKIVELSFYNNIAHLLTPVISTPEQSLQALRWCVHEMERRYQQLESLNVREIRSFNEKIKESHTSHKKMPYLVLIIDEFADLMMTCGKEIEMLVSRLTAKSRAVGIHIVVATQRPSTDVITGLIKSNIPTRISFMVTSKTDSRIILDMNGAEALLGKGDMLYSSSSDPFPERLQGPYLSEIEVQRIVSTVKELCGEPEYISDEIFSHGENQSTESSSISDDPLWDKAVEEVVDTRKASASHLQRRFKIGYNRAARLVEEMESLGIIGPLQNGNKREVFAD